MPLNSTTLIAAIGEYERQVSPHHPDIGRDVRDVIGGEALPAKQAYLNVTGREPITSLAVGNDREAENLQWLAHRRGENVIFERGALQDTVCSISYLAQSKFRLSSTPQLNQPELRRRLEMRAAGRQRVLILVTSDGSLDFAQAAIDASQRAKASTYLCLSRKQTENVQRAFGVASQADMVQLSAATLAALLGADATGSVACDIATARALGLGDMIVTRVAHGAIGCVQGEWISTEGRRVKRRDFGTGRPVFAGAFTGALDCGLAPEVALDLACVAGSLAVAGVPWEGLGDLDRHAAELERTPIVVGSVPSSMAPTRRVAATVTAGGVAALLLEWWTRS